MTHLTRRTVAALLLIASAACPAWASAPASDPAFLHETPLMVIRFNEAHVAYPKPLYQTVSQALKVKPSAVFDVVSIAPRAKDDSNQSYYNNLAAQNTHKVLETLHQIGLPANRISLTEAIDDGEFQRSPHFCSLTCRGSAAPVRIRELPRASNNFRT